MCWPKNVTPVFKNSVWDCHGIAGIAMALLSTEKWVGWSWRNAPWITEQNRQKAGGLGANKGVMNI